MQFHALSRHPIWILPRFAVLFCLMLLPAAPGVYGGNMSWSRSNGPDSGKVLALAVHPQNPRFLFAGTTAGIYKSTSGGMGWAFIGLGNANIFVLRIDPLGPGAVYAGTDSGIYKSTDGGAVWNSINNGLVGAFCYRILDLAIDPQSPGTIYAGTYGSGVFKSTDGGANWAPASNGLAALQISSLAIDPTDPDTLYAGTYNGGVFKSTDGAQSWNDASNGLATADIRALAINPQNPAIVYAGTNDSGIYKSPDGAASWGVANSAVAAIEALEIDPQHPGTLYVATTYNGVLKSTTSGMSWNTAGNELVNKTVWALAMDPHSPQTLYAGTDADGVFKSGDGGSIWGAVNSGFSATEVKTLAVDPQNPETLYAGTRSGLFKSGDRGGSWSLLSGGLPAFYIRDVAIDWQNPAILYVATGVGVFRSSNGGANWIVTVNGLSFTNIVSLAMDPHNSSILYAGTYGNGVFKSTNGGAFWNPANNSMDQTHVQALEIDPTNTAVLYAGTRDHGVFKSTDGGQTWNTASSGLTGTYINALAIDPQNPATVYVGASTGGVFKSADGGDSWSAVNSGLADTSIWSLAIDPQNPAIVYAGTVSLGIFKSLNGAYSWTAFSTGLANGSIYALAFAPTTPQEIFAGTWGSGVWTYTAGRLSLDLPLDAGGAAVASTSGAGSIRTGYAEAIVNSGTAPYGTAVFSFIQNDVSVSEAGVPASPPTTSARVFIDYRDGVTAVPGHSNSGIVAINTGIAVVNYSSSTANVTYTLHDLNGNPLAVGHGTVSAGYHFACFIDQLASVAAPDFALPPDFQYTTQFGSLDISSDQPLSVLALRGTNNQRNDFLITTTPVADLEQSPGTGLIYFPQFADGGGYTTSLILMNTSAVTETGTFQIMDGDGNHLIVNQVGGATDYTFNYSIPPNGAFRFQTDGLPSSTKTGWVRLTPDVSTFTPVGSGIFGYNPVDMLVSESGIPSAAATTHARVYVDLSSGHNTGLAIANVSGARSDITIHAFQNDGITPAGTSQGPLQLVVDGHTAAFADQFIAGLNVGFTGVLDISSTIPFAALTLRSLLNERHDFLMTTFPVADAFSNAPSPILFPHIADGGGYVTQFILISSGGAANTTLSLHDETGAPLEF
jgi:photosystem II stability/assembly factor-like uncharacterized protein